SRLIVPHGAAGAGAAAVRVPVEGRGEVPVTVVAIHVLERIGRDRRLVRIPVAIIDAGHLHLAILEVVGLTDADALTLDAVWLDPATAHAQGDLVGIANPILAAEAILAP